MKRTSLLIVGGLLFISCTADSVESPRDALASVDARGSVEASPTMTPSPAETLEATLACGGLGRPRPRGEVTFIEDDRLMAVTADGKHERCLVDLTDDLRSPVSEHLSWNGPADRVIVGDRALTKALAKTIALAPATAGPALWSRPNGTSVIYVTRDGRLLKRSSFGGAATDISFLARHDDVTYHPAGRHIATSGLAEDDSYGLYLATNVGAEEKLLARGEEARFITDLEFSPNGQELYYEARHGPQNWHLHRLIIGEDARLETLDKAEYGFDFKISQVDDFPPYVWSILGDCGAGEPDRLRLTPADGFEIPEDLRKTSLRPVGWLPNRTLVVASGPVSCSDAVAEDIYVLRRNRDPVLIAEGTGSTAAVRAVLRPPPPPPGVEQEVVA